MRQQARRSVEPVLSPTNPEPLIVNLINTSLREILSFIGNYSGINVTFDRDFQDRSITLKLEGVSLEQALQQIMISNQLFYKVLNERTIIVAADTTQKRQQYEDQVIRTFFISNADATEMLALLQGMLRVAGMAIQPQIVAEQDREHDHDSRDGAGGGRGRAHYRGQRQAARRSVGERADSRGQPRACEALRTRPGQLLGRLELLARSRLRAPMRGGRST